AGSFGSTPVVLVTNPATRAASGWGTAAPSWLAALDGTHPLAVPELETNSAGMLGMQALWQVGGKKAPAERRLAAALLRSGRSAVPTEGEALRAVAKGATGQPLVVTSERAMLAVNAASARPDLVAVFPSEGSPALDYPVYRVAPEARTASQGAGVDAVVAALTGAEGLAAARAAYLRSPDGSAPPAGAGGRVVRMPSPGAVEQGRFLVRLASIAKPSRVLVVVDVSESMRAAVPGTGLSRVQVAGKAAATAGDLLTDASSVGLWVFAVNLDGGAPYAKVAAVRPLGTALGGRTHRQVLVSSLLGLDERLAPGGTGLYRTARDAVRAAREEFDPRAVNTVVLMTDGTDEFGGGLTREQLVRTLTVEAGSAPDRPVRLVGIGIGPSADLGALRAMVAPTGGKAYRAETPAELRQVLLDVLARRG
ncbi:MAG: Ca-activated chloride channel, partial [Actinomycetota bacterium]|nr:Ca-activated chloride channel [Actinomycetota bacterium]